MTKRPHLTRKQTATQITKALGVRPMPDAWTQHHHRCPCITEQDNVPCTCPRGWPRRAAWWRGHAVYGARNVEALLRAVREGRA